jgi:hypothetical protein
MAVAMGLAQIVPVIDPLPDVEDQSAGLTQLDPVALPVNMGLTLIALSRLSDLVDVREPVRYRNNKSELQPALENEPRFRVLPAAEVEPEPVALVVTC